MCILQQGRQVLQSKDQDGTDSWSRAWIVRSEDYIFLPCFSYLFCTSSSFRCRVLWLRTEVDSEIQAVRSQ
ncbi:hypothetical protein QL285_058006 [Trifolium repens]|nr:hypothetical protein QL285_058006 [Trifolium repens]